MQIPDMIAEMSVIQMTASPHVVVSVAVTRVVRKVKNVFPYKDIYW